jgi:DNA-binding transcriptional MerR regulator
LLGHSERSPNKGPGSRICLTLESIPGFILCAMTESGKALRSGQLAQLTGVSTDTVRHYERMGLLSMAPRTASGYRMYSADAVERVKLVQCALQIGFNLTELAEVLRSRDNGTAPCHRVLKMTEEKLRSLERQIDELRRTRSYMRRLVRQWRKQLEGVSPGGKAMLLQALTSQAIVPTGSTRKFAGRRKI